MPPCPHCHTILSSLIRPVRVITSTPPSHPSLLFVILSFHSLCCSLGEELRGLLSSHEVMIAVHVWCGQNSSGPLAGSTSALVSCRATCYSVKRWYTFRSEEMSTLTPRWSIWKCLQCRMNGADLYYDQLFFFGIAALWRRCLLFQNIGSTPLSVQFSFFGHNLYVYK